MTVVLLRPSETLMKHAWPMAGLMHSSQKWHGLPQVPYGTISSPTYSPSKAFSILQPLSIYFPSPLGVVLLTPSPTVLPVSRLFSGTM